MQERTQLTQKEINRDLLSGVLSLPKWWLGLVTFLTLVFLADSALAAASHYDDMLIELKQQPWHKSSTRSNVVSLENDKGLLIERMPIEVDVSVYYEQQRQRALGAAQ